MTHRFYVTLSFAPKLSSDRKFGLTSAQMRNSESQRIDASSLILYIYIYIYICIYINSILIHKHLPWQKKGNTTFYLTMRSYDGVKHMDSWEAFCSPNSRILIYRQDFTETTDQPSLTLHLNTENIKRNMSHL